MTPVTVRLAAVSAVVLPASLLLGCGGGDPSSVAGEPGRSAAVPQRPVGFTGQPAATAEELFAELDAAIGAETSVHQENGNLNPPPPAILDQEFGAAGTDLRHYVDLGPTDEDLAGMSPEDAAEFEGDGLVFVIHRVDGVLYAEGSDPVPMADAARAVGGPLLATLQSDVRTDVARMAALARDLAFVGEEQVGGALTRHYRLVLDLDPERQPNPAIVPTAVSGPKPADLWIDTGGLPVRIDIEYGQPLGDIPGTGVSRTDYSRWSAPLEYDVDHLDWTVD